MKISFIFFFFLIFNLFSKNAFSLPTYINPNHWIEKPPAESKVNLHDELLYKVVPRFWYNLSPYGNNIGTKIEAEILIWEGKDFCAAVQYDIIFHADWAYDYSFLLGSKLERLYGRWRQTKNESKYPFYNEKCALYDTSADYSGKIKWQTNSNLGRIDKKKGIKGHLKAVRVQTFQYLNPVMECLYLAGGLGNSKWIGWNSALTLSSIRAHICVNDRSYFNSKRIKKIAKSLGVEDTLDASLKIKAPPPDELRIDLSMFNNITGKRDSYYVNNVSFSNNDNQSNNTENGSIEEKLIRLKKLFNENLITKDEYDAKKTEILALL